MLTILLAASFLFTQVSYSQNTSNEKLPLTFTYLGYAGVIDYTDMEIEVAVPFGTPLTGATVFTVSPFAQAHWDNAAPYDVATGTLMVSGNAYDWSVDPTYMVVEAENHSWERYEVIITVAAPSSAKNLDSFSVAGTEYKALPGGGLCDAGYAYGPVAATIDQGALTITLEVPFGVDLAALTTSGVYTGVGIAPAFGALNYAGPVAYTVTAEDGSTKVYTLTITKAVADNNKAMTAFSFVLPSGTYTGTIDQTTHIITVTVPFGTNLATDLKPTFTTDPLTRTWIGGMAGTEYCGDGTAVVDHSADVAYDVYAQDVTEIQTYTVKVTVGPASTVGTLDDIEFTADISMSCPSPSYEWESGVLTPGSSQTITYQYGADMTDVTLDFNFSDQFASVTEATIGALVDGNSYDVDANGLVLAITVTAQDGSTTLYNFTFVQGPMSNAKDMMEVGFYISTTTPANANNTANGLDVHSYDDAYDANLKFIIVVPWYTDLYQLEAYFEVSPYACVFVANADGSVGAAQTTNVTPNDHSNSITYVVRAQNGTEERYDVEVHKTIPSDDNTLVDLYFHELEICSVIVSNPLYDADGVAVTGGYDVTVRNGQDVSAVEVMFTVDATATVTVGGSTVVSGDVHDFTGGPLDFVVTAENGDQATYTVTVVFHAETSSYKYTHKKITAYNIPPALNAGKGIALDPEVVIDQDAYTIDVWLPWPARNHLTALVATFELNGGAGYPTVPWTVLTRSEDTQYPQESGVSENDYTTPIAYTVWDENCESVEYFVTVHIIPDESTGISCFEFGFSDCEPCELIEKIDVFAKRIYITVPYSVDISDLAPSNICLFSSEASIKPSVGSSSKWDDEQDWTDGAVNYTVTAPDGVTTAVWQVVVENPACTATTLWDEVHPTSTGETNVTIASPAGIVATTTGGKEMVEIDTETNTITITYKKGSDIDHVQMYWDLPCNATICCTGAPCVSTYLDFTEGNGCHTCIVTAEDVTVTEEWTICLIEEDYTVPEVWTESVIVWNCDDSAAVWMNEPGTVWIVEESFVSEIMYYQAMGTMDAFEDGIDLLEDAEDDHLAASAPYPGGELDSLGMPILLDSLGNRIKVYVPTTGLYSAAYYAFAVDLAGNLSCVSDEKFFIDICEMEVPCLEDVRDATIVEKYNESVYRYNVTGTVVVTYEDCTSKYIKYVQDECAAIKINDYTNYNHLPTYGIGQGLANLRGIVTWQLGVETGDEVTLEFIPLDCCPPTKVDGYTITPVELTYEEALNLGTHEYESQLVTITTPIMIEDDYDAYPDWTFYSSAIGWDRIYNGVDYWGESPIDGGYVIGGTFECANYMGVDFPSCPSLYTGIRTNFDSYTWGPWAGVTPRSKSDIVKASPTLVADPNPLVFGGVFVGTCETLSIDLHNFACGDIDVSALYLDNLAGDDTFELMTPLSPNPTTIDLSTPFTVEVKWCPVEIGSRSTTLVVEYDQVGGQGKILEIPINGSTPIVYEMPYSENWELWTTSKADGGYGYAQYYDDLHDTQTELGWNNSTCSGTDAVVSNWWGNNINNYSLMLRPRCTTPGAIWATTPGVVVSGSNPVVSWDEMGADYSGGANAAAPRQILISTDGINFVPWNAYTVADIPNKPVSQKRVYSLAAYVGETVYFKFIAGVHDPTAGYYPSNYTYWTLDNFYFGEEITTPVLVGDPNPLAIAATQAGETSTGTVTLTNAGISTALIKSVALEQVTAPGTPAPFVLVDENVYPIDIVNGTEAWVVNPMASVSFNVEFTPTTVGDFAANLIVTWGLYEDLEYVIPVTGTGLSCDVAESVGLGVTEFYQNNWYEYTPERFAIVTVLSCWPGNDDEGTYDTVVEVYENCGDASYIVRNDDHYYGNNLGEGYDYYGVTGDCNNRWASKATWIAEAGHSYKIFWPHYYSGSTPGPHMMTIIESYPQDGEICQAPIALEMDRRGYYANNMFGSTDDFDDDYTYSSCTPNANYMEGNDVVYTFTIGEDQPNGYLVGDIFGAFAGLHITDVCPSPDMTLANCIGKAFGSMGGSFRFKIEPGDYFAIASNWAPPQSVDYYFNLKWEDATGVNDVDLLNNVSVYPNPNDGQFTLQVNNPETADLVIELMDVQGQTIYKNEVKSVMNYNEEIDASAFAKGIYYLRVNNGTDIKVQKVVIQ